MLLRMFQKTFYQQGHRSLCREGRNELELGASRAGSQEHPETRNVRSIASSARRRPAARASRPAAVDRIADRPTTSGLRCGRRIADARWY